MGPSRGEAVAQGGPTVGFATFARRFRKICTSWQATTAMKRWPSAVADGAQAEFGHQAAKHRFRAGEGGVGPPEPFPAPEAISNLGESSRNRSRSPIVASGGCPSGGLAATAGIPRIRLEPVCGTMRGDL